MLDPGLNIEDLDFRVFVDNHLFRAGHDMIEVDIGERRVIIHQLVDPGSIDGSVLEQKLIEAGEVNVYMDIRYIRYIWSRFITAGGKAQCPQEKQAVMRIASHQASKQVQSRRGHG